MRLPALAASLACVSLSACGSAPRPPPAAATAQAQQAAAPAVEAAPAPAQPADTWVYSSVGKRDPFRSYLADAASRAATLTTRCATPLGRFEVEQLRLVAVVTGLEDPVGMVEAPGAVGYPVRRGMCIGKNGGMVAVVRSGEVVVSEWIVRADGTRDQTQTVLKLPKESAATLEE